MNKQPTLVDKLRSKDLLWFASILVILLGFCGIGYGIWITYNGILLKGITDGPILKALNTLGMSQDDGVYAFIIFGSCIIIFYGLTLGVGILGLISSNHLLVKRNIFWISVFLVVVFALFWIMGIMGGIAAILTMVVLCFFSYCLLRKYTNDSSKVKRKKRNGS